MEEILIDISSDAIVGSDLKYDDSYLLVEQEIDKAYSVSSEESTNWESVNTNCYSFLATKSKDMKIAVWWLYANWQLNKYEGLLNSLEVFEKLLDRYGEELYPKSLKAKQNTILWLETLFTKDIVEKKLHSDSLKNGIKIVELFKNVQTKLETLFQNEERYFSKVIRFINTLNEQRNDEELELEKQKQKEEEQKAKNEKEQKAKESKKSDEGFNLSEITSKDEAIKTLQFFKKSATLLSEYYRSQNPYDLKAIKLSRTLSWLNVDSQPIHKDGLTQINPPSDTTLLKIDELIDSSKKEEAYVLIQSTIEKAPFWLEGHYKSYEILQELKKEYEANEVKHTLQSFMLTNEGIEELRFKNDTPFLSNTTKTLLNISSESTKENNNTNKDIKEQNISQKIDEMIKNNQIKEAIKLLQEKQNKSTNQEEKFTLRLELVRLVLLSGNLKMALAILIDLEKEIQKYRLDEWRPDLASKVYFLLLKHFDGQKNTKEILDNAYEQLCRLDVSQALNFK